MDRLLLTVCLAAVMGCGASTRTGRERMDYAEKQAMEAERALDSADHALEALDPDEAEPLIREAKSALKVPEIIAYPDHDLLKERVELAERRLLDVRAELERRKVQERIAERKALVEEAREKLKGAMEATRAPVVTASEIADAKEAITKVHQTLDQGYELASKDEEYGQYARGVVQSLAEPRAEIDIATQVVVLREGPLAAARRADELRVKGEVEPDPEAKLALYTQARDEVRECASKVKKVLTDAPKVAERPIASDPAQPPTTARALAKDCARRVKDLDRMLTKLAKRAKAAKVSSIKSKKKKKAK